jgi:hypothetical protein
MALPNGVIVRLELDVHVHVLNPPPWLRTPTLINFARREIWKYSPVNFTVNIRPILYASHETSQVYEVEMRWGERPFQLRVVQLEFAIRWNPARLDI